MTEAALWFAAAAATVAFAAAFVASGLVDVARRAAGAAQDSMRALSDPTLDDAAKEQRARAASLQLFGAFGAIALRSALVLLAPLATLWALDAVGVAPLDVALDFLLRWEVIGAATLLGVLVWAVLGRRR